MPPKTTKTTDMGETFISGPNIQALSLSLTDKEESSDDSPEVKKPKKKLVREIYEKLQAVPPSLTQLQEVLGEDDTIVHLSSDEPKEENENFVGADASYDDDNEFETSSDDQVEEEALYSPQAGDTVKIRSADPKFKCYVARVDKKKGENLHCHWYYYPEEIKEGRKPFHGIGELFSSDHKTAQSVKTVLGKCVVHSIEDYCKLSEATYSDFYSRFHYDKKTGAYSPDTIEVFCKCEMPQNPECLMTKCRGCSEWFHSRCLSMTDEEAKNLEKLFCDKCRLSVVQRLRTGLCALGKLIEPHQFGKNWRCCF